MYLWFAKVKFKYRIYLWYGADISDVFLKQTAE